MKEVFDSASQVRKCFFSFYSFTVFSKNIFFAQNIFCWKLISLGFWANVSKCESASLRLIHIIIFSPELDYISGEN